MNLQIEEDTWFSILSPNQLDLLADYLKEKTYFYTQTDFVGVLIKKV